MQPRRVIVHAGFHKTGTTTIQRFLRSNGKHIWPKCSLTLPGRTRKGAARMAVRYSRFGTPALLNAFADDLQATLARIDPGRSRKILISDENFAGRMPGRDGQRAYSATPDLMVQAEEVIRRVFGADAEVIFHFTTRDPEDWLRSTYKHNLLHSRLTLTADAYGARFRAAADLLAVTEAVRARVGGRVQTSDLAQATGPEGPAAPLLDLIELPDHRRRKLEPLAVQNPSPDEDLLEGLLDLNRSNLGDDALKAAKSQLMQKVRPNE